MTEYARARARHRKPAEPAARLKRKKPMKHTSNKRAAVKRETDGPRREFVEAVGQCMVEGCPNAPQQTTHEITCGNGRRDALYQPRMQMAVCPKHHADFHNNLAWSKKRQLASRVRWELKQYCEEFCAGLGFAPSYFTVDELIDYLLYQKPVKKRGK